MNLRCMFAPRGVAVYGSVSPDKLARVLIERLVEGGKQDVYAVNPKGAGAGSVKGYTSILNIHDIVEMAVIASPARTVRDVMEECGKKGVKAAVIISSGFSEAGNTEEEEAVMKVAKKYGIRCVGPNCAGLINTHAHLVATLETAPPAGNISMISQSGAVGGSFMALCSDSDIGVAKFLSYGNGADLTVIDLLKYLKEDPDTNVVAMYLESVDNGRAFMETVREVCAVKPVIVVKSGRTSTGQRAAMSHTGSMAGSDNVFDAALRQAGAVRVDSLKDLADVCKGLAMLPPLKGRNVAVVTNSGGPGVMTTDFAEKMGMRVPESSDGLKDALSTFLPGYAGMKNPIDITVEGTGDQYRRSIVAALDEMDAAVAIYVGTPYLRAMEVAEGIATAALETGKPVTAVLQVGADIAESLTYLKEHNVPCYDLGESAIAVLEKMAVCSEQHAVTGDMCFEKIDPEGQLFQEKNRLLEPEAMALLRSNGISVPNIGFAKKAGEAVSYAEKIGYPLVMKVVSPQIVHKSEVGGVILGINSAEEVAKGFARLEKIGEGKDFRGVLLAPMLQGGREVILGLVKNAQFGPVVAFGMGGIYTEVLKDITFRVAPVSVREAEKMISEIRMFPVLKGVRGQKPADLKSLAETISRFSRLPLLYPDLEEVDLNPIFLYEEGLCVADARILGKS